MWSLLFIFSLNFAMLCDRASTKSSIESAGLVGTAERPFLTPKMASEGTTKVPSLDEFDAEIDIYKVGWVF